MRGGVKTLVAAAAILLVAIGIAACGGDDSGSTSTQAEAQSQSDSSKGDASTPGNGGDADDAGGASEDTGSAEADSGDFTPKQHDDSGGGSEQFRVKGGDNSVQEFGTEADTSEFEEAAAALHGFLDARAAGDWAAVCTYMSESFAEGLEKLGAQAKQVEDTSCAGVLEMLTNPAARAELRAEAEQADVASLRLEGERAFVIYRGVGGIVLAMPVSNEDGGWKIGGLAGTPLN